LGWELHHPIEMQNTIFDLLMEAGKEFDGIRPFGIRAMGTMAAGEILPAEQAFDQPSSFSRIVSEAGTRGRPGIVMISPQITTTKPAPPTGAPRAPAGEARSARRAGSDRS
jgi:hypothetical protein